MDRIVCYYTFQECCILYGIAKDKKLIIEKVIYRQRLPVEDLATILNSYSCDRATNANAAIAQVVTCTQYDFNLADNISRLESCFEYFEQMKATGRVDLEVKLRGGAITSKAVEMLVAELMPGLIGEAIDYNRCFAGDGTVNRRGWRRGF